jgi:hypothetical protein
MYIKYSIDNDKDNRVHLGSIRFITFMKCYIRGSMVRQSALFFRNDNRGSKCVQLLEFVCK